MKWQLIINGDLFYNEWLATARKLVSNTTIPCCFIDYVIFIIFTSYSIFYLGIYQITSNADILMSTYIGMRNIQFVASGVYVTVEWLSFEGGY